MKLFTLLMAMVSLSNAAQAQKVSNVQAVSALSKLLPAGYYTGKSNSGKDCAVTVTHSATEYVAKIEYTSNLSSAFELRNGSTVNGDQVLTQAGRVDSPTPVFAPYATRVGARTGTTKASNTTYSNYGYIQYSFYLEKSKKPGYDKTVTVFKTDATHGESLGGGGVFNCNIK